MGNSVYPHANLVASPYAILWFVHHQEETDLFLHLPDKMVKLDAENV
jgi:hypothetical protein